MTKEQQLMQTIGVDIRLAQVTVDGYTLNYALAGRGPAVIFLHGANIGWGQWYKTIAACAQSFTVIALDLPGAGGSTKVNYRKTDMLSETVSAVLQFIHILQSQLSVADVALVGHSFGGWVALQIAQQHPEAVRCCVASNSIGFSPKMSWHQRLLGLYPVAWALSKTVLKPGPENVHTFLLGACHNQSVLEDIFFEYAHESMHRNQLSHPFLFIHSLLSGLQLRKELLFQPGTLDAVKAACIIFGELDPIVSYRSHESRCRALLPKASIITYNTGHVPMLEASKEFNADLVSFLNQHSPACQYGVSH